MPQVQVEVTQLQVGDYDVGGDPRRVFERKTASDFLLSLQQGRLFEQFAAILASDFAPLLLLEGDPLRISRSQMRPEAIRGALTYLSAILHIPVLPSNGPESSALLLFSAARQCQVSYSVPGPAVGRRAASLSEQQVQVLLSLPGVGQATARALRARFGSLHELLNADAATLTEVPGVSPAKATALVQLIHAAFATPDADKDGDL